ncbi:MAG: gliding motility protein [Cytophagales bacterium]|nr:MAG: gliding motility protein [Cytophagales bacterium]
MQRHFIHLLSLLSLFALSQCNSAESECKYQINVGHIDAKVKIVRLEKEMFQLKNETEIKAFLNKYPQLRDNYFKGKSKMPDSVLVKIIANLINEKTLSDTLQKDVANFYGDMKNIEQQFKEAFQHIKYYYPQFKEPTIYTVITGLGAYFGSDIYVSEQSVVISLEFFMGKKMRYHPPASAIPQYIWHRYMPEIIVPTYLMAYSDKYNRIDPKDQTMLADMVYYGKAYQFVKTMMPCLPDSLVAGYTQEDLRNVSDVRNKKIIWSHFLEKNLLFSNNPIQKQAYLGERPFTAEIDSKAPGRLGRWLGWKIVMKYIDQNNDFVKMMENQNPQEIFSKSGYKGD